MKLSAYLKANDISDTDFASRVGMDRASVWRLRTGDTKPTWATAQKIAEATNGAVTPNDFLDELTDTEAAE